MSDLLTCSFQLRCICLNWLFGIRSHSHYIYIYQRLDVMFHSHVYRLENIKVWISDIHSSFTFSSAQMIRLWKWLLVSFLAMLTFLMCSAWVACLCRAHYVIWLLLSCSMYCRQDMQIRFTMSNLFLYPDKREHDESAFGATGDPCGPIRTAV